MLSLASGQLLQSLGIAALASGNQLAITFARMNWSAYIFCQSNASAVGNYSSTAHSSTVHQSMQLIDCNAKGKLLGRADVSRPNSGGDLP